MKKKWSNSNSTKAYTILTFAGVFGLFLLILFEVQRYKIKNTPVTLENTQRSFVHVKIPELNATVVGRGLRNKGDFFLGIPYVKPTERFQTSEIATIEKDSTSYFIHFSNGCPNGFVYLSAHLERLILKEKSCQTLNIYRCQKPKTNSTIEGMNLSPVLIYLNEGDWFTRSDSAILHPHSVLDNVACNGNTIVVSIQYRMGFYGFFSTQNALKVPGQPKNLALNDVRNGILWVNENIKYFGGDASRITVMGKGVGAQIASVLSSTTNNPLFQQLILLSGSSYVPTLYAKNYDAETTLNDKFDASLRMAIGANCTTSKEWGKILKLQKQQINQSEVAEYYKRVEDCAKTLLVTTVDYVQRRYKTETFVFWPLIGGIAKHAPNNPSSMPTIIGNCRRKTSVQTVNKLDDESLKILHTRLSKVGDVRQLSYAKEIIDHYENEFPIDKDINKTMKMIKRDFVLNGPTLLEAYYRSVVGSAPVYFFEYESSENLLRSQVDVAIELNKFAVSSDPDLQQVCLDDLLFNPLKKIELLPERQIGKTFARFLINFLHDGVPMDSGEGSANQLLSESLTENILEWPQFLPKNVKDLLNPTYDRDLNKVLKFDAVQGVYIANYQSQSNESRRFWLCNMAKKLQLKQSFCDAQGASPS